MAVHMVDPLQVCRFMSDAFTSFLACVSCCMVVHVFVYSRLWGVSVLHQIRCFRAPPCAMVQQPGIAFVASAFNMRPGREPVQQVANLVLVFFNQSDLEKELRDRM